MTHYNVLVPHSNAKVPDVANTDTIIVIESGISGEHGPQDRTQESHFKFRKEPRSGMTDGGKLAKNQIIVLTQDGKLILTPDTAEDDSEESVYIQPSEAQVSLEDEIHIEIISERSRSADVAPKPHNSFLSLSALYTTLLIDSNGKIKQNLKLYECGQCEKQFLTQKHLFHHVKHLHRDSERVPEECFACRELFALPTQLLHHLSSVHDIPQPDLVCEVCLQQFASSQACDAHRSCHAKSFHCNKCSQSFYAPVHLSQHQRLNHQIETLECHICGHVFHESHVLQMHTLRHGRAICGICNFSAAFQKSARTKDPEIVLIKHLQTNHSIDEVKEFLEILRKQDEEESQSGEISEAAGVLGDDTHEPSEGVALPKKQSKGEVLDSGNIQRKRPKKLKKKYYCKLCAALVPSYFALCQHRLEKHPLSRTCPLCGLSFEAQAGLVQHMNSHGTHSKKKQKSPHRTVSSDHQDERSEISAGKSVEDGMKCVQCDLHFTNNEDLLKHVINHQLPYKCSVCEKCFTLRRQYRLHLLTHGIRKVPSHAEYHCTLCSVRCRTLASLRAHTLTHTDRKPFKCSECGSVFRRSSGLRVHTKNVHRASGLHLCKECGPSWPGARTQASLQRHQLVVHHGVRRFVCGLCGARCPQNQDLRRHLRINHLLDKPPIPATAKKEVSKIHVIPPIEDLDNNSPLASKLRAIVIDEEQKLLAAAKVCRESLPSKEPSGNQAGSATSEKQSLNILGDVASQAAPMKKLKQVENHVDLASAVHVPSLGTTKYKCAVCQIIFDNLSSLSDHLSAHHGSRGAPNSLGSVNPTSVQSVIYSCSSVPSPLALPGLPYQSCVLPLSGGIMQHNQLEVLINSRSVPFLETALNPHSQVCQSSLTNLLKPVQILESRTGNCNLQCLSEQFVHSVVSKSSLPVCEEISEIISHQNEVTQSTQHCQENRRSPHSGGCAMVNEMPQLQYVTEETDNKCEGEVGILPVEEGTQTEASETPVNSASSNLGPVPLWLDCDLVNQGNVQEPDQSSSSNHGSHAKALWDGEKGAEYVQNHPSDVTTVLFPRINDTSLEEENRSHLEGLDEVQTSVQSENTAVRDSEKKLDFSSNEHNPGNEEGMTHLVDHNSGQINIHECETTTHLKPPAIMKATAEIGKEGPVTCDICSLQLSSQYNLDRHRSNRHSGVKQFACSDCGKEFAQKFNLVVHMRVHTGDRPYTCTICNKKMRYLKDFKEHKLFHEGTKSFQCAECGQTFLRQRDFTRHAHRHVDVSTRWRCSVCNKTFARADSLKVHIKSHELEKPGQTNQCTSSGLKLLGTEPLHHHQKKLLGSRDFTCEVCSRVFAKEAYLRSHLKTHANQGTYVACTQCSRRFSTAEKMLAHQNRFHRKKNESKILQHTLSTLNHSAEESANEVADRNSARNLDCEKGSRLEVSGTEASRNFISEAFNKTTNDSVELMFLEDGGASWTENGSDLQNVIYLEVIEGSNLT